MQRGSGAAARNLWFPVLRSARPVYPQRTTQDEAIASFSNRGGQKVLLLERMECWEAPEGASAHGSAAACGRHYQYRLQFLGVGFPMLADFSIAPAIFIITVAFLYKKLTRI